jgi:hypothetical protein
MNKIDETRIVKIDPRLHAMSYAAGWRYSFISHLTGQLVYGVNYQDAKRKLRWHTQQANERSALREDAAADGFKTRGCHANE